MHCERLTRKEHGKVVSSLYIYMVELPSRKLAVIEEVRTDEAYRGKGYATLLISQAIKLAKGRNCDCVELTTQEGNEGFYERLGFVDRKNKALRLPL